MLYVRSANHPYFFRIKDFFASYHIFKHFHVTECNNTCIIQQIGITFDIHFTKLF